MTVLPSLPEPTGDRVDVQMLLDSFVAIGSEPDEHTILERVVDLARMATRSRYGAAVLVGTGGITHLAHAGMTSRQVQVLPHPPRGEGVLGAVLAESRPVRLDRLQDHPASQGFPAGHVPMAAFLGVQIWSEQTLLGAVFLSKPPGHGVYSEDDETFVASLGAQAGMAVTSVRSSRAAATLADRLSAAEKLKGSALTGLSNDVSPEVAIERILDAARQHLGMQLSVVSRIDAGVQRFEHLSGPADSFGFREGQEFPAETGYCHYMLDGQTDGLIPDTRTDLLARSLQVTTAARVGAYAGVPLRLPTGALYGSLCTLSHEQRPLASSDRAFLIVLAELVGDQLARFEQQEHNRRTQEERLRPYLRPGGLRVVAQPVVDLHDGRVVGVEALARFPGWQGGGPDAVFAAAHSAGLGVDLELVAIAEALTLLPHLPEPLYLSVNAGPAAVLDPRLPQMLSSVPPGRLVLELTEHAAVEDYDAMRSALGRVAAYGVRTAVDDTGAGFASLQHILTLVPDMIKLDLTLVRGIDADSARQALAQSLVHFATGLDATLLAEGIETPSELETLRELGMRYGQGYHLGRPAPLAELDLATPRHVGSERRDPRSPGAALRRQAARPAGQQAAAGGDASRDQPPRRQDQGAVA